MKKINIRKRLKAFTIIEMIVSMLISGIVIGIIYYGFELFERQFNLYNKKTESNRVFVLLKSALNHDFESSDVIIDSSSQIIFYTGGMSNKQSMYSIDSNYVVRHSILENDTFNLPCRIHLIKSIAGIPQAIEEIFFQIKVDDVYAPIVFKKCYSARDLMDCEKNLNEKRN